MLLGFYMRGATMLFFFKETLYSHLHGTSKFCKIYIAV